MPCKEMDSASSTCLWMGPHPAKFKCILFHATHMTCTSAENETKTRTEAECKAA